MPILALDAALSADKNSIGGKAWSVARMMKLGIPVPPAFVITTDECHRYYDAGKKIPAEILAGLPEAVRRIEQLTGRTFGGGDKPLLVSVRSGAPISMPGMMDTILNLGINDDIERRLANMTGDPAYAADTRRRFEEQYHKVVGIVAPADPWQQLHGAVAAVFESWQSKRAVAYRANRNLSESLGTAVTVQAMVFGNLDDRSGTGVLFTRNPMNGKPDMYGEWLLHGQGEDVVSGSHTPRSLDDLAVTMPEVHHQLVDAVTTLERDARDMQDVEFTIESGKLWLLQSRNGKRSAEAAIRLAILYQQQGLISEAEALARIKDDDVASFLRPHVKPDVRAAATLLAQGTPACHGLVSGIVVTDVDEAEERALDGEAIILARPTTDPHDMHAMLVVSGILTELGGSTSHAAVVSREMGVACVVGCGENSLMPLAGQTVTIDGESGEVFAGALPVHQASAHDDPDLQQLASWVRRDIYDTKFPSLEKLVRDLEHSKD